MGTKDELKELIGKPCYFKDGTLYIRTKSDISIAGIEGDYVIIKSLFGGTSRNPISLISKIERVDLEVSEKQSDKLLLEGAKEGNLEMVQRAMHSGADVNAKCDHRTTALMYASMRGHLKVVEYLIEKGADVNLKSNTSALLAASMFGHLELVRHLIENGAEINQKVNGVSALKRASTFGHQEVVKLLTMLGAKKG